MALVSITVEIDETNLNTKAGVETLSVTAKIVLPNGLIYPAPFTIKNPTDDQKKLLTATSGVLGLDLPAAPAAA